MKSFRVLVVENNPDLLGLVVKYLELCGWHAAAAACEREFRHRLENDSPDVVVLDMGIADSLALVSAIKSDPRYDDIPVIGMTGPSIMADRYRCISGGCDRIIAKPFHLDDLGRQLERFVRKDAKKIRDMRRQIPVTLRRGRASVSSVGRLPNWRNSRG